jgi:hypothetical protein
MQRRVLVAFALFGALFSRQSVNCFTMMGVTDRNNRELRQPVMFNEVRIDDGPVLLIQRAFDNIQYTSKIPFIRTKQLNWFSWGQIS